MLLASHFLAEQLGPARQLLLLTENLVVIGLFQVFVSYPKALLDPEVLQEVGFRDAKELGERGVFWAGHSDGADCLKSFKIENLDCSLLKAITAIQQTAPLTDLQSCAF